MPHITPAPFLDRPVDILLVGCGGNGSQMLTGLARLNHALVNLGHPGLEVVAFDGDTVSDANIGRQLFSPADAGLHKSVVLMNRINAFFGLSWTAMPHPCSRKELRGVSSTTIVVMCVDSAKARASLAGGLEYAGYVMDMGNRAADGQVVFGATKVRALPEGSVHIRSPYEILPELIDTSVPEDDTPSCGLAEALERQELFINQSVVTPALAILWDFFRHGRLTWHGAFVNLKTGHMRPLLVPAA